MIQMKYPQFLGKNSLIAVPAPSAGASDELKVNKYKYANEYFKSNGYRTLLSKNIYKHYYMQFSCQSSNPLYTNQKLYIIFPWKKHKIKSKRWRIHEEMVSLLKQRDYYSNNNSQALINFQLELNQDSLISKCFNQDSCLSLRKYKYIK